MNDLTQLHNQHVSDKQYLTFLQEHLKVRLLLNENRNLSTWASLPTSKKEPYMIGIVQTFKKDYPMAISARTIKGSF